VIGRSCYYVIQVTTYHDFLRNWIKSYIFSEVIKTELCDKKAHT